MNAVSSHCARMRQDRSKAALVVNTGYLDVGEHVALEERAIDIDLAASAPGTGRTRSPEPRVRAASSFGYLRLIDGIPSEARNTSKSLSAERHSGSKEFKQRLRVRNTHRRVVENEVKPPRLANVPAGNRGVGIRGAPRATLERH